MKPTEAETRTRALVSELRNLRRAARISIRDMADKMGVSKSSLWELENNQRTHVPVDLAMDYAAALGLQLDFAFNSDESNVRDIGTLSP